MSDHVSIIRPPLEIDGNPLASPYVDGDGWWPAIKIGEFRSEMRVQADITDDRIIAAMRRAMQAALIDLAAWGYTQRFAGHASLADVPALVIDGVSHFVLCWRTAVMALTKAELVEIHRDYDATGAGERNADFVDETIIQLRRDAAHAIRDLKGRSRTFAELI